jgi:hypothetical protein
MTLRAEKSVERGHTVSKMRFYDAHKDQETSSYIQYHCLKYRGPIASKSNRGYETKRMQGDVASPGLHLQGVRKTTKDLIQDTRVSRSRLESDHPRIIKQEFPSLCCIVLYRCQYVCSYVRF